MGRRYLQSLGMVLGIKAWNDDLTVMLDEADSSQNVPIPKSSTSVYTKDQVCSINLPMCRRVTVHTCLVFVSVCLSVTTLVLTSFISMLKIRYVEVNIRLFSVFNSWIFNKSFCSEVMA